VKQSNSVNGVIMLVNEFPPLPVGGAEHQAERLSAWLAQRGWSVRVITRHAPGLPTQEARAGFEITRPFTGGSGKIRTLTFVLGTLFSLWKLRKSYCILHAHLAFGPAFAAVIIGRLLNKRAIVKLGNSGDFGDIQVSQSSWRGRLRLFAFRRWANTIITLDEAMHAEALAAGFDAGRLLRINNGIDAQAFAPALSRAEAHTQLGLQDKVVVLHVGRLAEQKALPTLLEALALALETAPDLHLILVGDGPKLSALEAQAQTLGLDGQITFAGQQANVRPYLAAADLFALPSTAEGISNALLEAMAAGLACLAAPVGGNPEVLDQGRCGLLLPMRDASAWGTALANLGNDSERRQSLGLAARQRILDQYDFSVVGKYYEDLYTHLLAGQQTKPVKTRRPV
jgi:glycosyltransferase involved in cell wall biosynthesis